MNTTRYPRVNKGNIPTRLLITRINLGFFRYNSIRLIRMGGLTSTRFTRDIRNALVSVYHTVSFLIFRFFGHFIRGLIRFFFVSRGIPCCEFCVVDGFRGKVRCELGYSGRGSCLSGSTSFVHVVRPFAYVYGRVWNFYKSSIKLEGGVEL